MIGKEEILLKIQELPPLPSSIIEILHLLKKDLHAGEGIAFFERNEDISSRVIPLVNAVFAADFPAFLTCSEACEKLGEPTVLEYSLGSEFMLFINSQPEQIDFWECDLCQHSFCVGLGAKVLAAELQSSSLPFVFISGFLHDIGKVYLDRFLHVNQDSVAQVALEKHVVVGQAEKETFGLDHTEIGEALTMHWRFPEPIVQAVRYHHTPAKCFAEPDSRLVDIVHVSDAISLMLGIGVGSEGMNYMASSEVKERLHLSRNIIEVVASKVFMGFESIKKAGLGR